MFLSTLMILTNPFVLGALVCTFITGLFLAIVYFDR